MNIKKLDSFIIILMLMVSLFSGHMFLRGFDNFSLDRDQLGVITLGINTVKVRPSGAYYWADAVKNFPLADSDMIYTHAMSEAQIKLNSGTEFTVSENSLFKLSKSSGEAMLQLEKGSVVANLKKGQILLINDGKTKITSDENSQVLIRQNANIQKVALVGGTINLDQGKSQIKLEKDNELVLEKDAAPVVNKVFKIKPLFPLDKSALRTLTSKVVSFKWDGMQSGHSIQISRDINFTKIVSRSKTVTLSRDGGYYWRVSDGTSWSNPHSFNLFIDTLPNIVAPKDKSIALMLDTQSKDRSKALVNIEWQETKNIDHYIATVTLPNEKVKTVKLKRNRFILRSTLVGDYNIQVNAIAGNEIIKGHSSSFKVKAKPFVSIPSSLLPLNNTVIQKFKHGILAHKLSWTTNNKEATHYIEIFDQSNKLLVTKELKSTSMIFSSTKFGEYSWRVRSKLEDSFTDFSPLSSIIFAKLDSDDLAPKNGEQIKLASPQSKIEFEWDEVDDSKYLFEVAQNLEFSNPIISKMLDDNEVEVSVPQIGSYYWRVKAILEDGNESFFETKSFEALPLQELDTPVIDQQMDLEIDIIKDPTSLHRVLKKIIDFIIPSAHAATKGTQAVITWKDYDDADSYKLELYRDNKLKNLVFSKTVKTNRYQFKNPAPGKYYWRIALIDSWGRQGEFSNLSEVNLKLSYKLIPLDSIKLQKPLNLKKVYGDIEFNWSKDDKVNKYILELSPDKRFKKNVERFTLNDNEFELKASKYLNKKLYWRVKGVGHYNKTIYSKRRVFMAVKRAPKKKKERELESSFYLHYAALDVDTEYEDDKFITQVNGTTWAGANLGGTYAVNSIKLNIDFDYTYSRGYIDDEMFYLSHATIGGRRNMLNYSSFSLDGVFGFSGIDYSESEINAYLGLKALARFDNFRLGYEFHIGPKGAPERYNRLSFEYKVSDRVFFSSYFFNQKYYVEAGDFDFNYSNFGIGITVR